MARGLNLFEDVGDIAVGSDYEGGACYAHKRSAGYGYFLPYAVGLGTAVVEIGEEREGEIELRLELQLIVGDVGGDADDDGVFGGEGGGMIAELAAFGGAAGGIGFGVKVEYDGFSLQGGEFERLAGFVGQV